MRILLMIAQFIRWHELKLAWKVYSREFILQHNLFGECWKEFSVNFDDSSLAALIKNLDLESVSLVRLLISRYSNPFSIYPSLYPKSVFTDHELSEQNAFRMRKRELGRKYRIPSSEVDPSPLMYQSGLIFIPDSAKARIKGTVVLDIGAFIGQASQSFLDFEPAKIFPFEPSVKNYGILNERLKSVIKTDQVTPVNCAMGDSKGFAYISEQGNASSITSKNTSSENGTRVNVNTVDSFVDENSITRVGLIKMDVEGFEMNVMNGAIKTIIRDKPLLLVSIYHTPIDFFKIKPMLENLNLGYRFLVRKTNPFWLTYDTMLICYVP